MYFYWCTDFVDIARRSSARGYSYITPRCAGLSAIAGLSCICMDSTTVLMMCRYCNYVSILYRFRDVSTSVAHVTSCELQLTGVLHASSNCNFCSLHLQTSKRKMCRRHRVFNWMDWIEQCFTSPPTQYRLYGRRFYRSKDPTNSIKSTEGTYNIHRYIEYSTTSFWLKHDYCK